MSCVISDFNLIQANQIVRLRGTDNQQNNTGLLYRVPTHQVSNLGFGEVSAALTRGAGGGTGEATRQGVGLGGFELFNSSGGTITVAIGVRIPNILWKAGQWDDDATTPYTDDTTDAQDAGANDFALETTTNNDGIVIHSDVPFNLVSYDVGTAGDAATRAARYSNTAGTGWTNVGTNILLDTFESTGERIHFFHTPPDWGRITGTGLSGIPSNRYALNLRATTAPAATVALADSLSVYRMYFINEALANNASYSWWPGGTEGAMIPGDALVAYFGTADNLNAVTALVRPRV